MKHPKISDLFDTLQAPDLPLEPDSACSAERIKAATLAKIQASQGQSPRHPRRKYKTLILAAALTLALSVGALAANDLLPGHIFQSFFGTGLGSNAEGVVEYTDDGRLVTNLPAWERVEVDASLAEEVLTPYLTTTDETISYAGYTLALEANLYDPATGCGLASYTLENPDGVTGYQVLEDGELWFDNQTVFARTDQAGHLFLDSGRSSDTKLCILEYYIAAAPLKDLDLELGAFVPDPENGGVYGETQDTLSIPLKAAQLPLAQAEQAGSLPAVTLSPHRALPLPDASRRRRQGPGRPGGYHLLSGPGICRRQPLCHSGYRQFSGQFLLRPLPLGFLVDLFLQPPGGHPAGGEGSGERPGNSSVTPPLPAKGGRAAEWRRGDSVGLHLPNDRGILNARPHPTRPPAGPPSERRNFLI